MKTILFDFDGTLVDTQHLYNIAVSNVLSKYNSKYTLEYCNEFFNGRCWNDAFEQLSKDENFDRISVFNEGLSYAKQLISQSAKVTHGTIEALHFLRKIDVDYAICSNSHGDEIVDVLNIVDLKSFFPQKNIFSREHVANGKPASDIYLYALEKLKKKPHECIVIEDSINGAIAGINAGIETIIFTGGTGFIGMNQFCETFGKEIKSYSSMLSAVQYANQ